MSDFLMREDAPLSAEEWAQLDKVVVGTARQFLVGRRFIELVGPVGAGTQTVPVGTGDARRFLTFETIEEDLTLYWKDVQASRQAGIPLDLGQVAAASAACAHKEDKMIFEGLMKAANKKVVLGDWDADSEAILGNIVEATEKLVSDDFYGPYAVVLSPNLYAKTQRVARGMGRLVSKLINDVAEGGMFQSPMLIKDQGLVLSLGVHNFDLVIAQDLITAYTGNEGLDHLLRVMESLVLRIKRPGAICVLKK
jgi:uncharacterized linocin/CFP29 family protein